jgi:hypothetical protein
MQKAFVQNNEDGLLLLQQACKFLENASFYQNILPAARLVEGMPFLLQIVNAEPAALAAARQVINASDDDMQNAAINYVKLVYTVHADDPYRVLGLSPWATTEEVRNRYRQLIRIFHPDRGMLKDAPDALDYAANVNIAFDAINQSATPIVQVQRRQPQSQAHEKRHVPLNTESLKKPFINSLVCVFSEMKMHFINNKNFYVLNGSRLLIGVSALCFGFLAFVYIDYAEDGSKIVIANAKNKSQDRDEALLSDSNIKTKPSVTLPNEAEPNQYATSEANIALIDQKAQLNPFVAEAKKNIDVATQASQLQSNQSAKDLNQDKIPNITEYSVSKNSQLQNAKSSVPLINADREKRVADKTSNEKVAKSSPVKSISTQVAVVDTKKVLSVDSPKSITPPKESQYPADVIRKTESAPIKPLVNMNAPSTQVNTKADVSSEAYAKPIQEIVKVSELDASRNLTPAVVIPDDVSGLQGKQLVNPEKGNEISTDELDTVVTNFIMSYNQGDIESFVQLMDDNVKTDTFKGKDKLRETYSKIFKITQVRELEIVNMDWKRSGNVLTGSSSYIANVKMNSDADIKITNGMLKLEVSKINGQTRIIGFYYKSTKGS